jgi:hypothetical protein
MKFYGSGASHAILYSQKSVQNHFVITGWQTNGEKITKSPGQLGTD